MRIPWILVAVLLLFGSCTLPSEAEKATCDAISPEYQNYVENDVNLSADQKLRRHRLIRTWRAKVDLPPLPLTPTESSNPAEPQPIVPPSQPFTPQSDGVIGMSSALVDRVPAAKQGTVALSSYNPKYRVVVFMGQSNINGRGASDRDDIPVLIWTSDKWATYSPKINSAGFFVPGGQAFWGPEYAFISEASKNKELATNLRVIKLASDGSLSVYLPGIGNSWGVDAPDSLTYLSIKQIEEAIETLGGWGRVATFTIIWYQGESEALWPQYFAAYYQEATEKVLSAFRDRFPVKVALFRIEIPEHSALPGVNKIRRMQEAMPTSYGILLDIDNINFFSDGIHIDEPSTDLVGYTLFNHWIIKQ